jgi:hypothetical protein
MDCSLANASPYHHHLISISTRIFHVGGTARARPYHILSRNTHTSELKANWCRRERPHLEYPFSFEFALLGVFDLIQVVYEIETALPRFEPTLVYPRHKIRRRVQKLEHRILSVLSVLSRHQLKTRIKQIPTSQCQMSITTTTRRRRRRRRRQRHKERRVGYERG